MRCAARYFRLNTSSACAARLVTGFKVREQDTRYMSGQMFREMLYPPEHPFQLPDRRRDRDDLGTDARADDRFSPAEFWPTAV